MPVPGSVRLVQGVAGWAIKLAERTDLPKLGTSDLPLQGTRRAVVASCETTPSRRSDLSSVLSETTAREPSLCIRLPSLNDLSPEAP